MVYRKLKDSNVWHFCTTCNSWPKKGFDQKDFTPPLARLCEKCKARRRGLLCKPIL